VSAASAPVQAQRCYHAAVKLHQLKVDYDAEQDRLLMLIATSDAAELRLWLTRRFVKLLWPLLVKLAEEANPRIHTQASPEARKALLGLEHQQAVQKADFSKAYEGKARSMPLGEEPLLLGRIQTGRDRRGQPVVAMHPAEGQGVTLTLDAVLLHSVCRLLQAAVKKSGWDMELRLPGTEAAAPAEERAGRTLN
jgi:hypothetical protein